VEERFTAVGIARDNTDGACVRGGSVGIGQPELERADARFGYAIRE
jgi:hypothetical protein